MLAPPMTTSNPAALDMIARRLLALVVDCGIRVRVSWRGPLLAVPTVVLVLLSAGQAAAADLQLVNEFGTAGTAPNQLTNNINDLQVGPDGNLLVTNAGNY